MTLTAVLLSISIAPVHASKWWNPTLAFPKFFMITFVSNSLVSLYAEFTICYSAFEVDILPPRN
ncbi:hypothetical protein KC19_VG195500 [Ceratodon purpureus]|uniref:Secreted protein n=1 Tax=Ceratodon purpureus TaxID=3225 RepID=A0A8T0HRS7_CERPU|nr:hypothetical protein KC19_VG195500 [Ceratodon purpureus]